MTWVEELRRHEAVYHRAPSAHNTQPWVVTYHDDHIDITADPARSLPDSDPTRRDLDLGIGAFVEACMIVAADAGLCVEAVGTRLVRAERPYATPFTAADVAARRVARGAYEPGTVDPAVLDQLGHDFVPLPTRDLAGLLQQADRWMFGTPAVALELRKWLRLSPRHPDYHRDGLTDRALTLSRPEAVLLDLALRAYPVTRRLGLPSILAASGRGLLSYHGTILVLREGQTDRVAGGRTLLRAWLTLARRGLAVHPLSQLIDCPSTAEQLTTLVGVTPLAVFRVGRPRAEPVRSARIMGG